MPDDTLDSFISNRSKRLPTLRGIIINNERKLEFVGKISRQASRFKRNKQIAISIYDIGTIRMQLYNVTIQHSSRQNIDRGSNQYIPDYGWIIAASGLLSNNIGRIYDEQAMLDKNPIIEDCFLVSEVVIMPLDNRGQRVSEISAQEGSYLSVHLYKDNESFRRLTELFASNNRSILTIQCRCWHYDNGYYLVQNDHANLQDDYIVFEIGQKSLLFSSSDINSYVKGVETRRNLTKSRPRSVFSFKGLRS